MPTVIEGVKLFTVKEVAEAMGVTHQTVRKYIKVGRLRAQRVGKPLLITEKSIRAFLDV